MNPDNYPKEGDLIKAHGCIALVLEVTPAPSGAWRKTPELRLLSNDGRRWVTQLLYTQWSIINEAG